MTTGERIKKRRVQLGLTVTEVADRLGVSIATMYRYEKGEIEKLPSSTLEPLARLLHTTPAWLMGWEDTGSAPHHPQGYIPLLGALLSNTNLLDEHNIEDYIPSPPFHHADFALQCRDNSMSSARIFDGDIVYIRACSDVSNGEIAAVLLDGQVLLRKVFQLPDRVTLRAENPLIPDYVLPVPDQADFRILGRATSFLSAVQHEVDRTDGEWRRFVGRPAAARGGGVKPMTEEQARIAWAHDQQQKRSGRGRPRKEKPDNDQ